MNTLSAVRRLKLVVAAMRRNEALVGLTLTADLFNIKGDDHRATFLAGTMMTTGKLDGVKDNAEALDKAVTNWSIELEVEFGTENK